MLEAAKAALEKAGFTIESLRNRIKELEAENEKIKESISCNGCTYEQYLLSWKKIPHVCSICKKQTPDQFWVG